MPLGFAYFLKRDICEPILAHRSDRIARYISRSAVTKYNDAWQCILYSLLIVYTNCQGVRTRHRSRLQTILDNLDGLDVFRGSTDPEKSLSRLRRIWRHTASIPQAATATRRVTSRTYPQRTTRPLSIFKRASMRCRKPLRRTPIAFLVLGLRLSLTSSTPFSSK